MENKNLTITTNEGKEIFVIDSREVAEMMGVTHRDIIEIIQGNSKNPGIIQTLTKGNYQISNYFIESSYKDTKGKERKCYLVTEMGCVLLGNKLQGGKGILFTAKYVEKFNEYENKLKELLIEDPIKRAERWIEKQKEQLKLK